MQIVIDIPVEVYGLLKYFEKGLGLNDKKEDDDVKTALIRAVVTGIPLPKGHGTLKDVDNIKTAFPSGEYVRTESVRATIDHEDTIIEADKSAIEDAIIEEAEEYEADFN